MSALQLPCLKDGDLEFLEEYRQILAPTAVALDILQGERTAYMVNCCPLCLRLTTN
jgi:hypothetical protein